MRRVLITGASSDIGISLCRLYLREGYHVLAHYRDGQTAFFDLLQGSREITPIVIDFADTGQLENALAEHSHVLRSADVLINAAAHYQPSPFREVRATDLIEAFSINTVPGIVLSRELAPAMMSRGFGRIVHLSSAGVRFRGGSSSFCYALSKHAMEFLPADLNAWAADNVFVNVLRVGVTDTRIHRRDPTKDMARRVALIPAARMAHPDEIAEAAFWLGSENNSFTTGQVIAVAGGE